MAPPSSGGVAVLQILGLLEHKDMANIKANSAEAIHYFSQASRIAFADRNKYIGDPDFTQVPTEELLNKDYIATRAKLITEKDQKAFLNRKYNLFTFLWFSTQLSDQLKIEDSKELLILEKWFQVLFLKGKL